MKRNGIPHRRLFLLVPVMFCLGFSLFARGSSERVSGEAHTKEGKAVQPAQDEGTGVEYPVTIEDDTGRIEGQENRIIVIDKPIERIVVGEKGCALVLREFGVLDRVVAVSKWIRQEIPEYGEKISIGGTNVDVELVIGLGPDLFVNLIGHNDKSDRQFLDAGVDVYTVGPVQNLSHIKEHITEYGLMFDKMEDAERIIRDMEKKEQRAEKMVAARGLPEEERPTVFMFGPMGDMKSLQTWAPSGDTFVEDLINKAGGRCLTADQGLTGWPQYSIEKMLESDPDIIITPFGEGLFTSVEQFTSLDIVKDLSAVKNNRVYGIDGELVFSLSYKNATALVKFAEFINQEP